MEGVEGEDSRKLPYKNHGSDTAWKEKCSLVSVMALLFLHMDLEHTDNCYLRGASCERGRTGTLADVNQKDVCGKSTGELTHWKEGCRADPEMTGAGFFFGGGGFGGGGLWSRTCLLGLSLLNCFPFSHFIILPEARSSRRVSMSSLAMPILWPVRALGWLTHRDTSQREGRNSPRGGGGYLF